VTNLIAMLTTDNGAWSHVSKLIESAMFENTFLIATAASKKRFDAPQGSKVEFIVIDPLKPVDETITIISNALKKNIGFEEVALNFASGNGKEHMALLSAVMKTGVGFRLVAATKEGVKEI